MSAEVLALIKEDQCGVCDNLHHSSLVMAYGHYHGRKHEKRLLKLLAEKGGEVPTKKGCSIESDNSSWQQPVVQMDPVRCPLCKVDFNGPACAELHYAGLKHRKRVNAVYQMAEFNFELEEEVGNPSAAEDWAFGMSSAFNQLSEEDREKMDEMNKIEAFLTHQAKTDAVLPNDEQQPNAANWNGLMTEQDIELYNETWESSPFYCSTCNTDCQNQGALDLHLKGKPHAKKVKSKNH